MYVCICHGVNKKTISKLLEEGKTISQIQKETKCGTECGICLQVLWDLASKEKLRKKSSETSE